MSVDTGGREAKTSRLPLAGVRVIDLSYVFAIPYAGGLLADLGAEVIKIEAPDRLDQTRSAFGPFLDNDPGEEPWERTGIFQVLNRGKRSFVLDMRDPLGRDLFKRLVAKSDIVLDNYTPRVMRGWGLEYAELRKVNPGIIMVSNTGYGSTGPWANFPSQGTTLEVTMGIANCTGYAGDVPWKVGQSYPDFLACWTALLSVLAALHYRRKTGEGQWIDLGMYQVGVALIPEPILRYQCDGSDWPRVGNHHWWKAPHNVYPAQGRDSWVAISIGSEEQWRHFAGAAGLDRLISDERFDTALNRWRNRQELDRIIAGWTAGLPAEEVMHRLQAVGVAAGPVWNSRDLLTNEHLRQRQFYETVVHPQPIGARPIIGRPFKLASAELRATAAAPRFGEGNRYVLSEVLGLSEAEVERLREAGVVADRPRVAVVGAPLNLEYLQRVGAIAEVDRNYGEKLAMAEPATNEAMSDGDPAESRRAGPRSHNLNV